MLNGQEESQADYSGYSDEQIRSMDAPPAFQSEEAPSNEGADSDSLDEVEVEQESTNEELQPEVEVEAEEGYEPEAEQPDTTVPVEDAEELATDEKADDETDTSASAQELAKLFAPFTANGKQVSVKNVDEAIKLMQQGAGFHKNMATVKPYVKAGKTLETNGMLTDDVLNYMIDAYKGNPDAIKKLAREHNVQLDSDFDEGTPSTYTPKNHGISDSREALDEVLAELESTPTYNRAVKVVGEEWDEASSNQVLQRPDLLRHINTHMANGVYDTVSKEVDRRKMFDKSLSNMSDIDAYLAVGDHLFKAGLLGSDESQPQDNADEQRQTLLKEQADKRNQKKKAAMQQPKRKAAPPVSAKQQLAALDPWAMTTEEFEIASKKLGINF